MIKFHLFTFESPGEIVRQCVETSKKDQVYKSEYQYIIPAPLTGNYLQSSFVFL